MLPIGCFNITDQSPPRILRHTPAVPSPFVVSLKLKQAFSSRDVRRMNVLHPVFSIISRRQFLTWIESPFCLCFHTWRIAQVRCDGWQQPSGYSFPLLEPGIESSVIKQEPIIALFSNNCIHILENYSSCLQFGNTSQGRLCPFGSEQGAADSHIPGRNRWGSASRCRHGRLWRYCWWRSWVGLWSSPWRRRQGCQQSAPRRRSNPGTQKTGKCTNTEE